METENVFVSRENHGNIDNGELNHALESKIESYWKEPEILLKTIL